MKKYVTLGEVCRINMGQSPDSSTYNKNGEGIPFYQGNADFGEMYPITRHWCTIPTKVVEKGDILVSVRAPIGALNIATEHCCIGRGLAAITVNSDMVSRNYIWYLLKSKVSMLQSLGTGSTFKAINKNVLNELCFQLSSLTEQDKISMTLKKVDLIIRNCTEILGGLDLLIKSQFVEMFGDPIDNPNGWNVKPLKELSSLITNGNTPKGGSENYIDNGVTFLRSQNIWRNKIDLSDVVYIDEITHRKMQKSSVRYKDILITKTGRVNTENSSLGRAALFLGKDGTANINGHVYLVRLNNSVVPEYVVTILTGEAYRKYIRKVCVGGIDKRQINLDQVEDFPIILPPIEQQNQFADFVKTIDKSKLAVKKTLEKAETLKKTLMQEYFG